MDVACVVHLGSAFRDLDSGFWVGGIWILGSGTREKWSRGKERERKAEREKETRKKGDRKEEKGRG